MRQIKKEIFKIIINLMSVYWAMYYLGELEEENKKNKTLKNKKVTVKVKNKKEAKSTKGKEKKKEQKNDK
jgi:hypothetical protein